MCTIPKPNLSKVEDKICEKIYGACDPLISLKWAMEETSSLQGMLNMFCNIRCMFCNFSNVLTIFCSLLQEVP